MILYFKQGKEKLHFLYCSSLRIKKNDKIPEVNIKNPKFEPLKIKKDENIIMDSEDKENLDEENNLITTPR